MAVLKIDNRLNLDQATLDSLPQLIDQANSTREKCSAPLNSGFHVGVAAKFISKEGEGLALGSNYERGGGPGLAIDDATHGEDSVVSNMLLQGHTKPRLKLVVLTTDAPEPAASCGRCRGTLETFATSEEMPVISAGTNGNVTMWSIRELLPAKLGISIPVSELDPMEIELVNAAAEASKRSFQPFSEKVIGRAGAAIRGARGGIFTGLKIDSSAFYGTEPVLVALGKLMLSDEDRFDTIVFYSKTGLPSGKERQELYDKASILDSRACRVVLVSSETQRAVITTIPELLPFPFGAGDIGIAWER